MSKMSQAAAKAAEDSHLDLEEKKALNKEAYEFMERLEAHTWCRKTQMEIQDFLRKVGYWPAKEKTEETVEL